MITQLAFCLACRGYSSECGLEALTARQRPHPATIDLPDRRGSNQANPDGNGRAVSWNLH